MKLYTEHSEVHLLQYIKRIKEENQSYYWHCVVSTLDKKYYLDNDKKTALSVLLQSSDLSQRDADIFWLPTGHLLLFTETSVEPITKTILDILNLLVREEDKPISPLATINLLKEWQRFYDVLNTIITPGTLAKEKETAEESSVLAPAEIPQEIGTIDLRSERRNRHSPKLLSIEDDSTTQMMIESMMEPYCNVTLARNATEAKKLYEDILPNIVFMDIELPDGNGKLLTEEFCKKDPNAFIVMVSGNLSMKTVDECIEAGARGFISKPVNKQINRMLYFINLYNSEKRSGSRTTASAQ